MLFDGAGRRTDSESPGTAEAEIESTVDAMTAPLYSCPELADLLEDVVSAEASAQGSTASHDDAQTTFTLNTVREG